MAHERDSSYPFRLGWRRASRKFEASVRAAVERDRGTNFGGGAGLPRLELRVERSEPVEYIQVSERQSSRLADVILGAVAYRTTQPRPATS